MNADLPHAAELELPAGRLSTLDAVRCQLAGRTCDARGCDDPAAALSDRSRGGRLLVYCEPHARLVVKLGARVVIWPRCAVDGCAELAQALALVPAGDRLELVEIVCLRHAAGDLRRR